MQRGMCRKLCCRCGRRREVHFPAASPSLLSLQLFPVAARTVAVSLRLVDARVRITAAIVTKRQGRDPPDYSVCGRRPPSGRRGCKTYSWLCSGERVTCAEAAKGLIGKRRRCADKRRRLPIVSPGADAMVLRISACHLANFPFEVLSGGMTVLIDNEVNPRPVETQRASECRT